MLQVYIRDEEYEGAIPNPSLCGFARIRLKEGERKTIRIPIKLRAFTSVDEQGERAVRSRKFTIFTGFSQPGARSEELTGHSVLVKAVEI